MVKLSQTQIDLLPDVRKSHDGKKSGKSVALVRLIDDYLNGVELSDMDGEILKLSVQLYQTAERQKKLNNKKRQLDYAEKQQANKNLTREKIILGACAHHVATKNMRRAYYDLLYAWADGFLREHDLSFIQSRHQMEHTYTTEKTTLGVDVRLNTWAIYGERHNNKTRWMMYETRDSGTRERYYTIQQFNPARNDWVNIGEPILVRTS